MSGGYILLHRAIIDHHIFAKEPLCEPMAWVWLLCQASYEPHKIRYHNKLIEVGRGDVPTSYRRLQDAFKWGVHRVRNFLGLLEQDGMITRKIETGFLIITVCNYEQYQNGLINTATQTATVSATLPTTHTTTNRKKGNKRERNIYTPEFENFLSAYPKNAASKSQAFKFYQKAIEQGADHAIIEQGAKRYAEYLNRTGYTEAHATTWLNQCRWEIEYDQLGSKPEPYRESKSDRAKAAIIRGLGITG